MITSVFAKMDLYPPFLSNYSTCPVSYCHLQIHTDDSLCDPPLLKVTSLHIKL